MLLIDKPIKIEKLKKMAVATFGDLVKAVVDIEKEIIVIDAPMHADEEEYLLESGSSQDNLWGINFYPDLVGEDFIEFDSMINVRPRLNNFTCGIDNADIRKQIQDVVNKLVKK